MAYISSVADNSGGNDLCTPADNTQPLTSPALDSWSATRWNHPNGPAEVRGLWVAGESPGLNLPASLDTFYTSTTSTGMMAAAVAQARSCGFTAYYWTAQRSPVGRHNPVRRLRRRDRLTRRPGAGRAAHAPEPPAPDPPAVRPRRARAEQPMPGAVREQQGITGTGGRRRKGHRGHDGRSRGADGTLGTLRTCPTALGPASTQPVAMRSMACRARKRGPRQLFRHPLCPPPDRRGDNPALMPRKARRCSPRYPSGEQTTTATPRLSRHARRAPLPRPGANPMSRSGRARTAHPHRPSRQGNRHGWQGTRVVAGLMWRIASA